MELNILNFRNCSTKPRQDGRESGVGRGRKVGHPGAGRQLKTADVQRWRPESIYLRAKGPPS